LVFENRTSGNALCDFDKCTQIKQFEKISKFFANAGQKKSLWVGSKSTCVKDGSASYLLQIKSMLWLGWVRAHPYYPLLLWNEKIVSLNIKVLVLVSSIKKYSKELNQIIDTFCDRLSLTVI